MRFDKSQFVLLYYLKQAFYKKLQKFKTYSPSRNRKFEILINVKIEAPGEMRVRDRRDERPPRGGGGGAGGRGGEYGRSRSRSPYRDNRRGGERRDMRRGGDRVRNERSRSRDRGDRNIDRDRGRVEQRGVGEEVRGGSYSRSKSRSYSRNRTPSPRAGRSQSRERSRSRGPGGPNDSGANGDRSVSPRRGSPRR